MNQIPDQEYPITIQATASTRDEKKMLMKHFFETDEVENEEGILVNRSKFLYLFGEKNTGKLTIIKETAQEVYGNDWESKIYIRVDEGQRYPYKLHAHKVESSRKVIFLTNKRCHWQKWRDLYPSTKTFLFEGVELIPNSQGLLTIRYNDFFQHLRNNNVEIRNQINQVVFDFFIEQNLSESLASSLTNRFTEVWRTRNIQTLTAIQNAEVPNEQY